MDAAQKVEFQPSLNLTDALGDAFSPGGVQVPLPPASEQPPPEQESPLASAEPVESADPWSENFARALQLQHARVRDFLQGQRDRWRQIAAKLTRQIDSLQAEVHALQAVNAGLQAELPLAAAEGESSEAAEDASRRYLMAVEDIRELKARNAELQRQLLEGQASAARQGMPAPSNGGMDWEAQKRRMLAELESDHHNDAESVNRRMKIEEIIARTDKIIAEKNREIEELQHLLNNQSNSLGSLAVGAAALEQVFDQDAIITEERERLRQVQVECREKLRTAEIELAMERARLARRDAELEEKLRNIESRQTAEGDALAPTGRPVRGRWRTQLGLTDDHPPENERGRR